MSDTSIKVGRSPARSVRTYWLLCVLSCALALLSFSGGALADAIDNYIAQEMTRKEVPGLALSIVRNRKIERARGYGVADRESGVAVNPDTMFEIGSITKQFTATLVMILVEQGKIRLDDRLPRYFAGTPDDWSKITLRHLLAHTSGIRNYTGLDGFAVTRHLTVGEFVRTIGQYPLESEPGAKFAYCNSGYNLLGFMIEKVTGQSYWDVLRARILVPLQMSSTFSRDLPRRSNQALGYEKKDGRLVPRDPNLTDVFAAGAMVSTVTDLAKWIEALDSGKLLKPATLAQMWTPTKLNDGTTYSYGFGWRLDDYKGQKNIGHSGSTSGFSASLQRFPEKSLAVVVLCNLGEQALATSIARGIVSIKSD
jgi:CubicO group peptidase (beta-lactamase class C family)